MRLKTTKMKDVDYKLHQPKSINFIPPDKLIDSYEADYATMNEEMIHSDSLVWKDLIDKLNDLNKEINSKPWQIEIPI